MSMVTNQNLCLPLPLQPPAAPTVAGGEHPRCPRCDSPETKFCYYNNYNTSQPRHFCKSCRRYWTLGGSLRNIPVGGTTRRGAAATRYSSPSNFSKRRRSSDPSSAITPSPPSSSSSPSSSVVIDYSAKPISAVAPLDHINPAVMDADVAGTFGALLAEPLLPAGFLALGDPFLQGGVRLGLGLRMGLGGMEELAAGFGLGRAAWPFVGEEIKEVVGFGQGLGAGGGEVDAWQQVVGDGGPTELWQQDFAVPAFPGTARGNFNFPL